MTPKQMSDTAWAAIHKVSRLQRHTNAGQMDLLDVETGKLDRLVEFVRSIANDEGRSVVDMINDARTVLAEVEG